MRDDPDLVRASQRARGADESLVDALLAADDARRAAVARADALRAEQKTLGEAVAQADRGRAAGRPGAGQGSWPPRSRPPRRTQARRRRGAARGAPRVPNVVEDGVPPGGEDDFVTLEHRRHARRRSTTRATTSRSAPRSARSTPSAAPRSSGARFYFLTGIGAQLEFALVNLAMAQADRGRLHPGHRAGAGQARRSMEGTGFLGAHAAEVYRLADDDLYLVGTSEVALAGYHADEILDAATCRCATPASPPASAARPAPTARTPAASSGCTGSTRSRCSATSPAEDAADEHQRLLAWEREFLDKLELAYRVIDVAAGDLGTSAARKFDIEAWFPSQGAYRELTSTSNCTTFQARRLNIRSRDGRPAPRRWPR